jgi:hypothetical protein
MRANNYWNYSNDGHSALINTNATHEPIPSGLPVKRPEIQTRNSSCERHNVSASRDCF